MRLLFVLAFVLLAPPAAQAQRLQVSINDGWRFYEGSLEGAGAAGFEDTEWQRVDLPHTWNAADAFDKTEGYRRGEGWYRRDLTLGEAHAGTRIFLYFEGANQVAEVFVNGQRAGQHVGGYTAFCFDVTDLVRVPGSNTVAVRVDNRHDPDIPPLDADFTFYGGIYRDVWLVATDPVHIDLLDHAGPGVYLTTPDITDASATVTARVRVTNDATTASNVRLTHRVFDSENTEVARWNGERRVAGGTTETVTTSGRVANPQRWSPPNPHLYRVETDVLDESGALLDRVTQPLGFRTLRVEGDGFYLNGQKTTLTGTNRHQDRPGKGNALTNADHRRDVELIKDTGFNFLRLAHYPQDEAVLRATDAVGLAVWEEIPVVNTITQSEAFARHAETMLVEMIKQHYNHPSVVMWGYMNEILLRPLDPLPEGYVADIEALAQHLDSVAKREDPSRPTAMAVTDGMARETSPASSKRLNDIPDVLGLNLYFGWYYGTFADLGPFLDDVHARHPEQGLMVSEYGAGTDERVHAENPVAFDFSVEHGEAFHRESFPQIQARDYMVGSAVWNQFDFGSAGRQDTKNALNQKGLFYFDRTPKDIAFYYKALLSDEPVLHIEREHRHRRRGDCVQTTCTTPPREPVQVYTNADIVLLRVNGRLVEHAVPVEGRAVFSVHMTPGTQQLRGRGLLGHPRGANGCCDVQPLRERVSDEIRRGHGGQPRRGLQLHRCHRHRLRTGCSEEHAHAPPRLRDGRRPAVSGVRRNHRSDEPQPGRWRVRRDIRLHGA